MGSGRPSTCPRSPGVRRRHPAQRTSGGDRRSLGSRRPSQRLEPPSSAARALDRRTATLGENSRHAGRRLPTTGSRFHNAAGSSLALPGRERGSPHGLMRVRRSGVMVVGGSGGFRKRQADSVIFRGLGEGPVVGGRPRCSRARVVPTGAVAPGVGDWNARPMSPWHRSNVAIRARGSAHRPSEGRTRPPENARCGSRGSVTPQFRRGRSREPVRISGGGARSLTRRPERAVRSTDTLLDLSADPGPANPATFSGRGHAVRHQVHLREIRWTPRGRSRRWFGILAYQRATPPLSR